MINKNYYTAVGSIHTFILVQLSNPVTNTAEIISLSYKCYKV